MLGKRERAAVIEIVWYYLGMKKVITIVIIIIILVAGLFLLSKENQESTRIDSIYGFSFTPPEGWVLWEGVSAIKDSVNAELPSGENNSDFVIQESLQKYVDDWKPQDSQDLVFTKSDVDTQTRDLDIIAKYSYKSMNNPSAYDNVSLGFINLPTNYSPKEKNSERGELRYITFLERKARMSRIKALDDTYDLMAINFPTDNENTLFVLRNITKNENTQDVIIFLEEFLSGLNLSL